MLLGIAQIIGFIGLIELGFGYQEENIASECKSRFVVIFIIIITDTF